MIQCILIYALSVILSATVSSNNLPSFIATLHGSGIVGKKTRIALVLIGVSLGLFLEGWKLIKFKELIPQPGSNVLITCALILTLIIFLVSTSLGIPISLSHVLAAFLIGSSISLSLFQNYPYIGLIALSWILTPIISLLLSLISFYFADKLFSKKSIWTRTKAFKMSLLIASTYTAYVFGCNTLGLLAAVTFVDSLGFLQTTLIVWIGSVFGVLLGGERTVKKVSRGIYELGYSTGLSSQVGGALTIELFTQLSVPVSVTQATVSGLIGPALAKRIKIIKWRNYFYMLAQWFIAPILAFLLGYLTPLIM